MKTRQRFVALAVLCLGALSAGVALGQDPLDEIRRQAAAGDIGAALAGLRETLAEDPNRVDAVFLRGVLLYEAGRVEPARRAFERVIRHNPEMPEAYNNLAVIQAAAGDYNGAIETLKMGLGTNSSYHTAYENLTRIFAQLASEAYGRALEVESPDRSHVGLVFLDALSVGPPSADPPPADGGTSIAAEAPTGAVVVDRDAGGAAAAVPVATEASAEEPAPQEVEEAVEEAVEEGEAPAYAGDVARVVTEWAEAWSDQRVDDYLAFYADSFAPGDGSSRSDWAALRRERVSGPEYIRVNVAILDSTVAGGDLATVTFMQAYESDRFSDQVTKTLEFARREGEWKIVRETAEP